MKTIAPGAFRTRFGNSISYTVGNAKTDLKDKSLNFQKCYAEILEEPPKPFGYGDPQVVADLIYKCATEKTPNKNFVGKDAKTTIKMRKLMPKSSYNKMIKNALLPK